MMEPINETMETVYGVGSPRLQQGQDATDLLALVPPERWDELFQRLENEFDIAFDDAVDEEMTGIEDMIDLIEGHLQDKGTLPKPLPGESADDYYETFFPKFREVLAGFLGLDPLELSAGSVLREIVPFRQQRSAFSELVKASGNRYWSLCSSTAGCSTLFIVSLLAALAASWGIHCSTGQLFGAVFGSVPVFIAAAWLTDYFVTGYTCHFPYRTLGDFARSVSEGWEKNGIRRQIDLRAYAVLVSLLENEPELSAKAQELIAAAEHPLDEHGHCLHHDHGGGCTGGCGHR